LIDHLDCPLCASDSVNSFSEANGKLYHICGNCRLIFLDPQFFISIEEENQRYQSHNNDPNDERYLTHLRKLTDPLKEYLKPGMVGLDYGCGEGKPISHILEQSGITVKNYDLFFFEDKDLLKDKYDFITCTETAEHFHQPAKEFNLFSEMLKTGGILGIMTNFYSDDTDFERWWYPRDPTHVCFYSKETFDWIYSKYQYEELLFGKDIIILRK